MRKSSIFKAIFYYTSVVHLSFVLNLNFNEMIYSCALDIKWENIIAIKRRNTYECRNIDFHFDVNQNVNGSSF